MVEDGAYSIDQLAELLDLKKRTIYFWAQSKLLDGPGAGAGAYCYTDDHLGKLALIKKLRAEQKSLDEIRKIVKQEAPETIRALAEKAKAAPPRPAESAKELIQRLLAEPAQHRVGHRPGPDFHRARVHAPEPAPSSGALWERIALVPGMELHVRRPLSPATRELVNELVAHARRSSKEPSR